uniref:Protein phosphatase 2 regulatory subunit B'gamma n=1 Tax=Rhinopithecus bieti TaxID=61621 RepID=A0A2K6MVV3_RHIBE
MLTCNKAGSRMVVDAANSNGPFQPVALLHIRVEALKLGRVSAELRLEVPDLQLWLPAEQQGEQTQGDPSSPQSMDRAASLLSLALLSLLPTCHP